LICFVTKEGKNQINCVALADLLQQHFNWTLNKTMRPHGCKLVISEDIAPAWEDLVTSVKAAIQMIKDDPSLNHNKEVELYDLATMMPDPIVLDTVGKLHSAYLLDTL
jgi:hypothetical protein